MIDAVTTRWPYTSLAFVQFVSPSHMWTWLKSISGTKFPRDCPVSVEDGTVAAPLEPEVRRLWFNVESTIEERSLARRVKSTSMAIKAAFAAAGIADAEEQSNVRIHGLGDKGMNIWAPKNKDDAHPVRVVERVPGTFEVWALEGGHSALSQLMLGDSAPLAVRPGPVATYAHRSFWALFLCVRCASCRLIIALRLVRARRWPDTSTLSEQERAHSPT